MARDHIPDARLERVHLVSAGELSRKKKKYSPNHPGQTDMNVDVLRFWNYFCEVYVKNSWKTNVFSFARVFNIISGFFLVGGEWGGGSLAYFEND